MPIGDSSHQISVVVHQHAQLVVFPELEPLAEVFAAEPNWPWGAPGVAQGTQYVSGTHRHRLATGC
jgi:hypothetical protein